MLTLAVELFTCCGGAAHQMLVGGCNDTRRALTTGTFTVSVGTITRGFLGLVTLSRDITSPGFCKCLNLQYIVKAHFFHTGHELSPGSAQGS